MDLWRAVDSVLLADRQDRAGRPKKSFWASEALGCRRKTYYQFCGSPVAPPDLTSLYRMGTGDLLHHWLYDTISRAGFFDWKPDVEVPFQATPEGLSLPVSGRLDLVGTCGNRRVAVDLKSTFGAGVRSVRDDGPSEHHLAQMLCYLAWGGIDELQLAYLGRDDQFRVSFTLTLKDGNQLLVDGAPSSVTVARIVERFKSVERALEQDTVPARDYRAAIRDGEVVRSFQRDSVRYKSDWQCFYCGHQRSCWDDQLRKFSVGTNKESFAGTGG